MQLSFPVTSICRLNILSLAGNSSYSCLTVNLDSQCDSLSRSILLQDAIIKQRLLYYILILIIGFLTISYLILLQHPQLHCNHSIR
ncbi:hypothetical protein M501DRAFT_839215 [Patellaria atrata CBS 101060]|uniref:Uncharacterized protein n=1 Tax=Patellaria atrata CBS 101060 TaxID=1346257 RepID=A0A9P4SAB7_9PEZI|nr:hypothetical protein M501DRAFT_839215 [Patellaria atrata CBS 101060]